MTDTINTIRNLPVDLDRDIFLRSLVRELAGTLESIVGYEEAASYISLVGQNMGEWLNSLYKKELGATCLSRQQVAAVLVDLKNRIQGCFAIEEQDEGKIVFTSSACPFEDKVLQRASMCMMTSNVFGVIAANNLGYAKVVLCETIAQGDGGCRVIVHLQKNEAADAAVGREYYGS